MNKHLIYYTSIMLLFIFFFYMAISVIPATSSFITPVSAIDEEDVFKGLGIAFILYLISRLGSSQEDIPDTLDELTPEEKDLFTRLVYAEARGEPFKGQIAVAAVVLNRVESNLFPDSIEEVIYQGEQFTPVRDGSIDNIPDENALKAVAQALEGEDPSHNALYFHNPDTARNPEWFTHNTRQTAKIGNHIFSR